MGFFWMGGGMFAIRLTSGKTQRGHDFYLKIEKFYWIFVKITNDNNKW